MHRFAAVCTLVAILVGQHEAQAFRSSAAGLSSRGRFGIDNKLQASTTTMYAARKTLVLGRESGTLITSSSTSSYDPLGLASQYDGRLSQDDLAPCRPNQKRNNHHRKNSNNNPLWASSAVLAPLLLGSESANAEGESVVPAAVTTTAAATATAAKSVISKDIMNPATFQPVCPASDNFYRFLQGAIESIVGRDKFIEYGPLIAGGLLRVRLELCVVESFFNEAVGPFIKENGVSWILPIHETVETFLAGSIFALATTFILVGSTKLLTVITTYFDLIVGLPSRTFGGFFYDRALGRPVTLDIGFGPFKSRLLGPPAEVLENKESELVDLSSPVTLLIVLSSGSINLLGKASKFLREFLEAIDLFVGRYLVFFATFYIGVKFLHFKVFPDFP